MYSWAVLVLTWAVLVILKIYGPFWSGPFWFMVVLVVSLTADGHSNENAKI